MDRLLARIVLNDPLLDVCAIKRSVLGGKANWNLETTSYIEVLETVRYIEDLL